VNAANNTNKDEMRPEYDLDELTGRIRGKYHEHYSADARAVKIDADLATTFPDSKAVNGALRELLVRRQQESG